MNLESLQEWFVTPIGRTALAALVFALVVLGLQLVKLVARRVVRRLARRTDHPLDGRAEQFIQVTSPLFIGALGVFAGVQVLEPSGRLEMWIERGVLLVVLWQLGRWAAGFVIYLVDRLGRREHARFDRFHVDRPGDNGFELELVYWVDDPDFTLHMDVKQDILIETTRLLIRVGARYAVPARRLSPAALDAATA